MLTGAQKDALATLANGPLDELAITVQGVRRDVLRRLSSAGLVRWHPYSGKSGAWRITKDGQSALAQATFWNRY